MATAVTTVAGVLLLVKDSDATHWNPSENISSVYKRGDIVEVFPGDVPVSLPPAAPFYIIRIVDVTMEQAAPYMEQPADGSLRRTYQVNIDAINPPARMNELLTDRYIEVTFQQIRNALRNKVTGQTQ